MMVGTDLYSSSSDVILRMTFTLSLFLPHQPSASSLQTKIKGLDKNDRDWGGPCSQSRKSSNRIGNQKHGLSIQSHSLQYNHFCLELIIKKLISLMVEKHSHRKVLFKQDSNKWNKHSTNSISLQGKPAIISKYHFAGLSQLLK